MSGIKRVLLVLLVLSISNAFALPPQAASKQKQKGRQDSSATSWVDKTLASMSLDERVGQLIIPAVIGMFMSQDGDAYQQIKRDITEFHVGGYHVLGDVNILHEPAGVALLLNHMQEMARVPLWVTADFEGGAGLRYLGATRLPRAMAMAPQGTRSWSFKRLASLRKKPAPSVFT